MPPSLHFARPFLAPAVIYVALPGPTRQRHRREYCYRLTYRSPEPARAGCALLWEVEGGRLPYQIALEREETGRLRWHCTCADAVYRGEDRPHVCKHVRGLLRVGRDSPPNGACPGNYAPTRK